MKIKILGTRGEIEPSCPYHNKHSGVLVDKKLLIDAGEKKFLNSHPEAILITHLHPDHAFFEGAKESWPNVQIPIYGPEKSKKAPVEILKKKKNILDFQITPIPTEHSLKVKSQAYIIEKDKKKILYTGDLFWIKKEYIQKLKKFDLVITEASFLRKGGRISRSYEGKAYGHAGIPNLIHMFKPITNNILFIHFGSWFFDYGAKKSKQKIKLLAKENNINLFVGYDGMEISL